MNTRMLIFPIATAAVMALDGCDGVTLADPSVKACHDDTTVIAFTHSPKDTALFIRRADHRTCRAA